MTQFRQASVAGPITASMMSAVVAAIVAAIAVSATGSPVRAEGGGAQAPSAAGACENPTAFCQRQLDADCLSRVGAGSIAVDTAPAGCDAQFSAYRDCLALVAGQCGPATATPPSRDVGPVDGATMTAIWNEIKDSGNADALESFAESYPDSPLAVLASARAAALRANAAPTPDAGRAPPPQNNDLRAQSSAVCAAVITALEPFLDKAKPRTRDLVRQGSADGRYSLPMLYYRVSAGSPRFDAEHGPRVDQWREAAAAFRLIAPDDAVRRIEFFDKIITEEIEEARFMNRGQMLAWLTTLDSKGAEFKARCRRMVQG